MKRLGLSIAGILLALSMGACKCAVEKTAVSQFEGTHKLIAAQFMIYVNADPKLNQKAKDDWKALVESDQRNIDALKKATE